MGLAKELRARRKLEAREVLVPAWGDESGAFKLYWCNGRFDCNESNGRERPEAI